MIRSASRMPPMILSIKARLSFGLLVVETGIIVVIVVGLELVVVGLVTIVDVTVVKWVPLVVAVEVVVVLWWLVVVDPNVFVDVEIGIVVLFKVVVILGREVELVLSFLGVVVVR